MIQKVYRRITESVILQGVLTYARELAFYARVHHMSIHAPSKETQVRKFTHVLERYLFYPETHSKELAAELAASIEKILAETKEGIPQDLRRWAERIVKEYHQGAGKTFCPLLINGAKRPPSPVETAALMKLMRARRSRRVFDNVPLTDEQKKMITAVAQWTPSACNRQSIRLIFVEEPGLKKFIASTVSGGHQFFDNAPCILIFVADPRDYRYPGDKSNPFMEVGAAVQNVYLLCESMDLGCCWGSYSSNGSVLREKEVRERLGIPSHYIIIASLAIGKSSQMVCEIPRSKPEDRFFVDRFEQKP